MVAPHVGAWIETRLELDLTLPHLSVAPHVGAWIETVFGYTYRVVDDGSRPTWARGLKRLAPRNDCAGLLVAPHVGAWIETAHAQAHER